MPHLNQYLLDEVTKFNEGKHHHAYSIFGAHKTSVNGVEGYRFTVWAPRAKSVSLVGDFNNWQAEPMSPLYESGAWTLFRADVYAMQKYKYEIGTQNGDHHFKIDPFARQFEMPPKDASLVCDDDYFEWSDHDYLKKRWHKSKFRTPLNIYEVHKNSWMKHLDNSNYSFDDLIERLIPYVKDMGYTHIELMPVMEHPLEASWGYQITGYFAVAARYGTVQELKRFVNACHQQDIGVILDFVPGHFCQNHEAMAYFDGTATFEYENSIKAYNKRWGALNFDLGKTQVNSFLYSSLMYWIEEFHVDGIRVDAVSNMLYLDYDLPPHVLNEDGSNLNYLGIQFLKEMNRLVKASHPDVYMIAEESTNYPKVTGSVEDGGLGFDLKWNMGWMNDILRFFEMDPLYRNHHFNLVTFIFIYMHNEKYVLPLSHDEIVHGKKSLLGKMPGDRYKQFAQLKILNLLMQILPGGSLNFMSNEIGQFLEWRYYSEVEWKDLGYEFNKEYQHFIKTMNHIVKESPAIYQESFDAAGIEVIDANDEQCILVIKRKSQDHILYAAINFLPVERQNFRFSVEEEGVYEVFINTEMQEFGGSWIKNLPVMTTNQKNIEMTLPAYGGLLIRKRGLE